MTVDPDLGGWAWSRIAAYLGKRDGADRALALSTQAYADQNERDYEALRAAVASGRVTAEYDL